MNPFAATYEELAGDFGARGIPYDSLGFCDHPSFLAVERTDKNYLNHYAAFVAKRGYDSAYLAKTKTVIDELATCIQVELVKNGRLGACVDISATLFRMLEEEQIWSCCVKGSLTITFPQESGINTRCFWSVDHGSFVAGHAWLYAPPYTVVDISVRQQPYKNKEKEFIPERILTTNDKLADVDVDDIVSPTARMELLANGVPPHRHLATVAKFVPEIFRAFPAIEVLGLQGARLKYSPVAIHAPREKLLGLKNITFSGLTPWQFYKSHFAGKPDGRA